MMANFFQTDDTLQTQLSQVLDRTWARFPTLAPNQIAVTWLVYTEPYIVNIGGALSAEAFWRQQPQGASYRGGERIYPASIVKLFYLVAIHEWLEQGMTQPSLELERAMRDMIVDSSNDATGYVLDVLTGTTSGPELPPGPFETWKHQRNLINRYLRTLNWPELSTINANQKTWCDGPYGRERAFLGEAYENRNMLTTESSARLLHSIIGGVAVNAQRSQAMMGLMLRDLEPQALKADPENQVTGFLGAGVPLGTRIWSKAGLTSKVRHDAAYVETDGVHPYLLVVFTEGAEHSQNEAILPFVSAQILAVMRTMQPS